MNQQTISVSGAVISHHAAMRVLNAVVEQATALQASVCAAVVCPAARLVGFVCMDGSFGLAAELAQKKARCAASLGISPDQVEQQLDSEDPRVKQGLNRHADFILIRGGLPIVDQGQLIGAVGVSGSSEAIDLQCAQAGYSSLGINESPGSF